MRSLVGPSAGVCASEKVSQKVAFSKPKAIGIFYECFIGKQAFTKLKAGDMFF